MALRVLIVTEDDPLYVVRFFEVFLEELPWEEMEIVGMTISQAFDESRLDTARRVLGFYGPRDFVRLLGRFVAAKARRQSIAALARKHDVPLIEAQSVNDPAYIERVRALQPDVIVSVAAPEIFGQALLESAGQMCLNLHTGRLPTYRGMMPSFWQMLNGERHATVTVHQMAPRLDAGAVLGTQELPILDRDSLARLMSEGKREGARLMIRVLRELAAGGAREQPLDLGDASYFSFPTAGDAHRLRRLGHSLL